MEFTEKEKSSKDDLSIEKDPELKGDFKNDSVDQDLNILDEKQAEFIFQQAALMSDEDAETIMREVLDEHRYDPFFPATTLDLAKQFIENPDFRNEKTLKQIKVEAALIVHDSPYVEVRAVVDPHDDPSIPCNTLRAWVIGLFLACSGSLINQLFSLRYPSIYVNEIVAQLLAYPLGTYWGRWVYAGEFNTFGYKWTLNPGKFTRKEHMLITIMANVSFDVGYSGYIIIVQLLPNFFNQSWAQDFGYQITLSLSLQLLGYGLAGLSRRFLVYPAAAVWPRNLASIALNNSFHAELNPVANGWKITQLRFFLYAFLGMFVYFWFPNYIAQFLSYFSWITWISPDNVILATVSGVETGMGLNPFPTLDWNVVIGISEPLVQPFFSTLNVFIGMLITFPMILAIWFTNTWYTAYIPININKPFDRFGNIYKVTKVVNADGLFDQAAYEAYSPLYLGAANAFLYGAFFAVYPATLVYAYIYHRKEIVRGFKTLITKRNPKDSYRDVHNRLMSVYPEVPEWWYFSLLLFALGLGLIALLAYPTHTTVGAQFMGLALALVFIIPIGVIYSITNMEVTLNVLSEFLGGALFPGNALAMNMFKSYGYVTTHRALRFAQDLKLGHYTKIPPRVLFMSQTFATILSTLVAMAILNWQVTSIPGICTKAAQARFTCPGQNTFFTASVIWGTLGPVRMYGKDGPYNVLLWGFLLGAVLPVPVYLLSRKYPDNKFIRGIHVPVLISGALNWAPYNLAYAWPATIFGYIFQVVIRKRYLPWWQKYNYILSTAFDCGIAISAIVMFFALQWANIEIPWWGNDIVGTGADASGAPLLDIPEAGYWGPGPGEFH